MSTEITRSVLKDGRVMMSRLTTAEEQGYRSFDIIFWQELSSEQRAAAVWELVVFAWEMKGKNLDELRFQRSVESIRGNVR